MTIVTTYHLDEEDRLVAVGGAWDTFAQENDGLCTDAHDVVGRSLWDFVKGDPTRMWVDVLLRQARSKREALERPYRCDSPTLRRFMTMCIVPEPNGLLRVEHHLLRIEQRPVPVYIYHHTGQSPEIISLRCSFCGRIKVGPTVWEEPLPSPGEPVCTLTVAYTVCGECKQAIKNMVERNHSIPKD